MANNNDKRKSTSNNATEEDRASKANRFRKGGKNSGRGNNSNQKRGAKGTSRPQGGRNFNDATDGLNDYSWYNNYPELTEACARIPFTWYPGVAKNIGIAKPTDATNAVQVYLDNAGTWAIHWVPTIGYCVEATDPANIVAKELFARIRSKYSGSLEADPADILMYVLAIDSVYSYIAFLRRLYRTSDVHTALNRYLPESLFTESKVDYNDFIKNKDQVYYMINTLSNMINKFECPAVMDLFKRHYFMNENIYMDAPRLNSQMYMFIQDMWYKFKHVAETGSALTNVSIPRTLKGRSSVNDLFDFGLDLVKALSEWEDAYTINGYLMRAFENAPLIRLEPMPLLDTMVPVYVPEVLMQIENAYIAGVVDTSEASLGVTQDPAKGIVLHKPKCTAPTVSKFAEIQLDPVLNIRSDAPSVESVVIASRLTNVPYKDVSGPDYIIDAGTEIVTEFSVVAGMYMNKGGDVRESHRVHIDSSVYDFHATPVAASLNSFDWHPHVYSVYSPNGTDFFVTYSGNSDNMTVVSPQDMSEIHRVCLYSEFNAFGILGT